MMKVQDTANAAEEPADLADEAEAREQPRGPLYPNAAAWVEGFLTLHYARRNPGFRWCAYWWQHVEAASRLEALWQAWEQARLSDDFSAISHWWLEHCDPQMAMLTAATGPFAQCDAIQERHALPERLAVVSPPEGMYRGWDHPEEEHYS